MYLCAHLRAHLRARDHAIGTLCSVQVFSCYFRAEQNYKLVLLYWFKGEIS